MRKATTLQLTMVALLWLASRGCDVCTDGDLRCHPVEEEVEVCADGQWTTEERCCGQRDCCLENDDGSGAHCTDRCWTSSCETEPIGS